VALGGGLEGFVGGRLNAPMGSVGTSLPRLLGWCPVMTRSWLGGMEGRARGTFAAGGAGGRRAGKGFSHHEPAVHALLHSHACMHTHTYMHRHMHTHTHA